MVTKIERLQYKNALENVSRLKPYYKYAKKLLRLIEGYGFYYEVIDEKTIPSVRQKATKVNFIFNMLQEYVVIEKKFVKRFGHDFFDHFEVKSFKIPNAILDRFDNEYREMVKLDKYFKELNKPSKHDDDLSL